MLNSLDAILRHNTHARTGHGHHPAHYSSTFTYTPQRHHRRWPAAVELSICTLDLQLRILHELSWIVTSGKLTPWPAKAVSLKRKESTHTQLQTDSTSSRNTRWDKYLNKRSRMVKKKGINVGVAQGIVLVLAVTKGRTPSALRQ